MIKNVTRGQFYKQFEGQKGNIIRKEGEINYLEFDNKKELAEKFKINLIDLSNLGWKDSELVQANLSKISRSSTFRKNNPC